MLDSSRDTDVKNSEAFCAGVQKIIDDTEDKSMFEHLGEYVSMICHLARYIWHMVCTLTGLGAIMILCLGLCSSYFRPPFLSP